MDLSKCSEVISLTFGDQGENHVGMEKVGKIVAQGNGFNVDDLVGYRDFFETNGFSGEIYNLNDLLNKSTHKDQGETAHVLVIRSGMNYFLQKIKKTPNDMFREMNSFEWDRKYYDTRRKKVLNKNARANVCFGSSGVEPDYENKIGRVVSYDSVPTLKVIKDNLPLVLGFKGENMICEGNRYFDLRKCGIGWHGDAERRKVVAFRLGETMDLHYHWFIRHNPVGETLKLTLNNGDMYIMSEKAVGTDWKRSSILTLRHSAGKEGSKYLVLNK